MKKFMFILIIFILIIFTGCTTAKHLTTAETVNVDEVTRRTIRTTTFAPDTGDVESVSEIVEITEIETVKQSDTETKTTTDRTIIPLRYKIIFGFFVGLFLFMAYRMLPGVKK